MPGLGEVKIQLCSDIIQSVRNKHSSLSKRSASVKDANAADKENKNHENANKDKIKIEKHVENTLKQHKSVRFLEQSGKFINGSEKINATLDEENNFKNRIEINEYMRRAGSPQPGDQA